MTSMYSYNITLSTITDRGYTSHEHLPNFGLINMNVPIKREQSQACLSYAEREAHRGEASTYGRVYDPMTMNFLSPDPVLQNPSNSQNYNRFSYVLNNPLKYTDPSGHVFLDPWYEYMAGPKRFLTWVNEDLGKDFSDLYNRKWIKKAEKFEDIAKIIDLKRDNFLVKYELLKEYSKSKNLNVDGVNVFDINRLAISKSMDIGQLIPAILRHTPLGLPMNNNPLYLAEAVSIDGGFTIVGTEKDWGAILLLAGKDAGMIRFYEELAGGIGCDVGVGVEITRIDYAGDLEKFSFYTLEGERRKGYLNIGNAFSVGGAYTWGYDSYDKLVTGKSIQFGIGASVISWVSFGYNHGILSTFK